MSLGYHLGRKGQAASAGGLASPGRGHYLSCMADHSVPHAAPRRRFASAGRPARALAAFAVAAAFGAAVAGFGAAPARGEGIAAPEGFVAAWRAATLEGCLPALETGDTVDGAAYGLEEAPGLDLAYSAPSTVWQERRGRFALGLVGFPLEDGDRAGDGTGAGGGVGAGGDGGDGAADGARLLCEAANLQYLHAQTVNATYSDFLDWAEAAQDAGRYAFLGTRYDRDWLTGIAALRSRFVTDRGVALEVTFVAQPAEGRVSFSAVEMPVPVPE